jgi:MOSC domain-containing protein YiiM
MKQGTVFAINVSDGGVPKRSRESAALRREGLEGDRQQDLRYHGGPDRAVVLYSLELIRALQAEGHPITPGAIGENLTISGLDWAALRAGARLGVNDAVLEITEPAEPCRKLAACFADGRFTRVSEKSHPGWSRMCARVLRGGTVRVDDPVVILEAND